MLSRTITFSLGLVTGAFLTLTIGRVALNNDIGRSVDNANTEVEVGSNNLQSNKQPLLIERDSPSKGTPRKSAVKPAPAEDLSDIRSTASTLVIPEIYRPAIGPANPPLTFGEEYELFSREAIDSVWAQPMENGINSYLATQGASSGFVFDFVQCRSTACVIAGYTVNDSADSDYQSIVKGMLNKGWWDAGSSLHYSGSEAGGRKIKVLMVPRYDY